MTEGKKTYCPPPGPSLPPPKGVNIATSIHIFDSSARIQQSPLNYPWYDTTTFTIKASISGATAIETAHRPSEQTTSPAREQPLDVQQSGLPGSDEPRDPLFDTKFRIASVTKVFTVLAVLLSKDKIGWEDPITKFVPELDAEVYGEITIGSLADHTSGLGRFGYVGDLAVIPGLDPAHLGLPAMQNTLPGCDLFPGSRFGTREEVIDMFNHASFAPFSPHSGPLYSNIAYNLLSMALSTVHSQPYEEVIQSLILNPLKMASSSFSTPESSSSAILPGPGDAGWFAAPFGNFDPSGGLWSTPNDMHRFLTSVLTHNLLSSSATRKWLQPTSLLPSLHQLVGAPWEIIRPTDLDVHVSRVIDIHTKPGGVPGYAGYAVLIPEFGIAATINAAGNDAEAAIIDLLPLVVKPLVKHADELARAQAATKYAGTYKSADNNSTVTLALDEGPGIHVESLSVNGVSVLPIWANLQKMETHDIDARLFPIDLDNIGSGKEKWRMLLDRSKGSAEKGFAELERASWNWGDKLRYMREPLDGVVFEFDNHRAGSITLVGWRTTLDRQVM